MILLYQKKFLFRKRGAKYSPNIFLVPFLLVNHELKLLNGNLIIFNSFILSLHFWKRTNSLKFSIPYPLGISDGAVAVELPGVPEEDGGGLCEAAGGREVVGAVSVVVPAKARHRTLPPIHDLFRSPFYMPPHPDNCTYRPFQKALPRSSVYVN